MLDACALSAGTWPGRCPTNVLELIQAGPESWQRFDDILRFEMARGLRTGHALTEIRWHAPIPRPPRNVVCLAQNYAGHARESAKARGRELKIPDVPVFFTKATNTVIGPFDPIPSHRGITSQIDWEAELGVVIGQRGVDIGRARALDHVFGYTVVNDVSARDLQLGHVQFFKGKSLDGFCPMGPVIVTADEFGDPQTKRVVCVVNGVVKQDGHTSDMIFPVEAIVEWLSRGLTLEPGDVIATGTPEGVGMGRTPPEFLLDGDLLETEIHGIGRLRNQVRDLSSRNTA